MAKATVCSMTVGLFGGALVGSARADYGPGGYSSSGATAGQGDIVGIGSDTVQNIGNFVADGDTTGDAGYNSGGGASKLITFDATPDANDRAGYLNGSTNTALSPLNPTIILRGGTSPVQRPNGSGSGVAALLADNNYPTSTVINYVRMSRLPKCTENNTAVQRGFGGLHVVQAAKDPLGFAVVTSTAAPSHAPAGFSITESVNVYKGIWTTWGQVPGYTGAFPNNTIIPLIPQSGSGTRATFLADLQAANGGVAVTPSPTATVTTEENDPSALTGSSSPADTISPFSGGRLNLFANGYFHDPNAVFPGGAALNPPVKLLAGTAPDGAASYNNNRGLFFVFRDNDRNAGPWQPGSTKNWVNTLFLGAGNFLASPFGGQPDIQAAGVSPQYADLGVGAPNACT